MSVLYLLTAPAPPIGGTDAVFNEVKALQSELGGESLNLYPFPARTVRVPRQVYGLHALPALLKAEARHNINHIYFPVLHWFPVFRLLRKPIVYSVTATLDRSKPPRNLSRLNDLARIIVSNNRDAETLKAFGLSNYELIAPGVETRGISRHPVPLGDNLTLLMASAPWHRRHFDSKGIDVLLEAAAQLPYLKLILLWRGLLLEELAGRIARYQLGEHVEIVNEKVDVDHYLGRAHATVLFAKEGYVVKAFPHSLVESLAACKPVLLNGKIPMADYVGQLGCGVVVDSVNVSAVVAAIEALKRNYAELASNTAALPSPLFSMRSMIEQHQRLYAELGSRAP